MGIDHFYNCIAISDIILSINNGFLVLIALTKVHSSKHVKTLDTCIINMSEFLIIYRKINLWTALHYEILYSNAK